MDPITHGLLGASVAQISSSNNLRKKMTIVGALAAMAADLDIVCYSTKNPTLFMLYHRGFTHALSFILCGGIIVALFCLLLFSSLRHHWRYVIPITIVAYATHCLCDACTSFGTQLLWPFNHDRIAWDIIAIVDPIFTGILALGVYYGYKKQAPRFTAICFVLALCYLLFGVYQHHRALNMQQQLATARGQIIVRGRVFPDLGNLLHFRSAYVNQQEQIYLDRINTPLFRTANYTEFFPVPLFSQSQIPYPYRTNPILMRDFTIFAWFADGYITAADKSPLTIADLRYISGQQTLTALWGIEFPTTTPRKHVYWLRNVKLKNK